MIEKTLTTTHGKLKVKIPTVLNEVTLGQMMALQEKDDLDDLGAISILSEVSKDELLNVSNFNDFQVFGDHIQSLAHQVNYLYSSTIVPDKVTFVQGERRVTVNVIRNLSVEPAGAFLAAREIIAEEITEHIKLYGEEDWQGRFQPSLNACCNVLAQYFFCRVTGKRYDEYEAEEFADEIKKLRVTEALPIAKHFFSCYPNLLKQRTSYFQLLRQYWRERRAYRLLKSLNI